MKLISLIIDGNADIGYYADDFVRNRVTTIARFHTAIGTHRVCTETPLQMVDDLSTEELKNIMAVRLNRFVQKDLFGRAFNMVKRLKKIA